MLLARVEGADGRWVVAYVSGSGTDSVSMLVVVSLILGRKSESTRFINVE